MSLTSGSRLGSYEVTALIGQGGMGEVYRARDTKLGRDVALKVLPDLFADDPERLARFQRAARESTRGRGTLTVERSAQASGLNRPTERLHAANLEDV